MKQIYTTVAMLFIAAISFAQQPIITSIVDGTCTGGTPKLIEIYASGTVDFTQFTLEKSSNGGAFGAGFDLSGFGTRTDSFVYVYSGTEAILNSEFPSIAASDYLSSNTANNNGDDAVRIIETASMTVVDIYGAEVDGTGETWEYLDSYAKRVDGTGPDATFNQANWISTAPNTLDNQCGTSTFEVIVSTGTFTTTAVTTPTITVSGSIVGLDYFENNGPSQEGTVNVNGINLTADITAVSSDFEMSLTSGGTFVSSLTIPQTGGDVSNVTVYVRLKAGLTAATYTEDITFDSGAAPQQLVNVSGTVSPDVPQITVGGSVDLLNYFDGAGPSQEDTIGIAGLFLTSDIVVTATAPFEVSLTTGTGFGSSVNVPFGTGNVAFTDIFVRLPAGQTVGNYTGTLTFSSTGVTDETEMLEGNVLPSASCAAVGSVIITEIMNNPSINSDPAGEYFELYNTTSTAIDIQSWIIKDEASTTEVHTIATSLIVPANGYIVIGNAATPNGGVTLDYTYANDISLGNGSDGIIIECGGNTIDEVIWDNGATFPDPSGASMELSTTALNATDNDLGTNWGTAVTAFGDGDLGTPGAANDFTLSNGTFESNTFKIYPNPAATGSTVNVVSSNGEAVNVVIYSTLGQKVLAVNALTNTLNVGNLDSGMYIVRISQGEATQTRKLIIK